MSYRTVLLNGLAYVLMLGLIAACASEPDEANIDLEVNVLVRELLVSQTTDRSQAKPLDSSWVSGNIYVFADLTNPGGVNFYLDDSELTGPPLRRERLLPFDLMGSDEQEIPRPFDTRSLSDGIHTVSAELIGSGKVLTATFLVDNSGSWRDQFLLSPSATRQGAKNLGGASVSGNIYSFFIPGQRVESIEFFLDGSLYKTERIPFYDLASTEVDGSSRALDTTTLTDGPHTLRAVLKTASGQREVKADFSVQNQAPTPEPTPPEPTPPEPTVGLDNRPENSTCLAPTRPQTSLSLEQRFSALSFNNLLGLKQAPGDDAYWYALEKSGRVLRFPNNGAASRELSTVIDLRTIVNDGGEGGLLGLAFHPNFASNGYVFLSYTYGNLRSRIARFKSSDGGKTLDTGSERVILEVDQPYNNHNGGDIAFGPGGYLFIALGDGGSGGDPQGNGQNKDTLLGSVLRVDVNGGDPYKIPSDNPFANGGGAKEIFAYGFRNPWRMSFDRGTGQLWAGDVGQGAYEEIDIVSKGKNYGWNIREGRHCYGSGSCSTEGLTDPVHEYGRTQGQSVTGGYVYRGNQLAELKGSYVYGDFVTGTVWALRQDGGSLKNRQLLNANFNISSFAEANSGELYVLDFGGKIYQLVNGSAAGGFPQKLSQTGCVNSQNPSQMAQGVIPYEVALPFWSDGAEKNRWFALPEGSSFKVNSDGDWELPPGGVSIKEFRLGGKRLETRFYVRHSDGSYSGYTYEWNDAQTEATLLTAGKTKDVGSQTWIFPSSAECAACHTAAAGHSLGLETRQLNRLATYPSTGRTARQLETLKHIGMLPPSTPQYQAFPPLGDTSRSKLERTQAYLDVNCSNCHRPGGPGRGEMDLRHSTPLSSSKTCNVNPAFGNLGVADAKLVTPGDRSKSILWQRLKRRDGFAMPPISSTVHDQQASEFIGSWIDELSSCP